VIESGEISLPGKVSMKNIGLPKNVAYACLAETIVLALDGRFEEFHRRPQYRMGEGCVKSTAWAASTE